MKFGGKKTNGQHATLSDIVRGMLHAVNGSQVILEQHYEAMMKRYFDNEGKPLTKTFVIDSERSVEVPVITLINPSAMALKEMDLEMSVHIDEVNLKSINSNTDEAARGSFDVSIVPSAPSSAKRPADMIDICMKFRAIDPPEGISRVLDEYFKRIEPGKTD